MTGFTGSCACGELKYEVDAAPLKKALCHCNNCHKLTGTAYTTNVLVPTPSFKLTSGTPKHWNFVQKPSEIPFTTTFCGNCGTVLHKETDNEAFKGVTILQAGTVDGDAVEGKPDVELWTTMRKEWIPAIEGAAQAKTFS